MSTQQDQFALPHEIKPQGNDVCEQLSPSKNLFWRLLLPTGRELWLLLPVVAVKILLIFLFSSDYQDKLFIPFVSHFLDNFDNPWSYFLGHPSGIEFPYHPLMLYILAIFYAPYHYLVGSPSALGSFFFQLPSLLSDLCIYVVLRNLFPKNINQLLIVYFLSPIIIYAVYMHSQLDLLPTAVFFVSIFLLTKGKSKLSAVGFGIAVCIKLHVIAGLPLLLIYINKHSGRLATLKYLIISGLIYLIVCYPYLLSEGFYRLVLANEKNALVYTATYDIGSMSIYILYLLIIIIYSRFFFYHKTNNDLLYSFLAMLFSLFVLVIEPAPGWYIWLVPFVSILYIKLGKRDNRMYFAWAALSTAYIFFFIFFYSSKYVDLTLLGQAVNLKITNSHLINTSFTMLEAALLGNIIIFYRYGVRSNATYKRQFATVIGISGDSGSGKTTLLRDIRGLLGTGIFDKQEGVLGIEGDGDHKWERNHEMWSRYTHLDPKANYLHRQADNLLALKRGSKVYRSDYDHTTGTFTKSCPVEPQQYIVLSGLHTLYLPKMRKIIDVKIFLDTDETLRRHWKIIRDMSKRGYDSQKLLDQLDARTRDSVRYIQPQKEFADIIIRYFTEDHYTLGDPSSVPHINLQITLDASIPLEEVILEIEKKGIDIFWEYSEDLQTQHLILREPVDRQLVDQLSQKIISNPEEVIRSRPIWASGHRRMVQLILLLVLSEKLKAGDLGI